MGKVHNFKKDIILGKPGEYQALEIALHYWPTKHIYLPSGEKEQKAFDFALDKTKEGLIYFEVKTDFQTIETGNVAVEFESSGKPSGIQTTWAKYWVTRVVLSSLFSKFYFARTQDMLQLASKESVGVKEGGENARMDLVKWLRVREISFLVVNQKYEINKGSEVKNDNG